jgi:hypothetical protein
MTDGANTDSDAEWRSPVEDGWEPETPRRGPVDWYRGHPDAGPVAWFRASPARFFGVLGTILFVGGWAVAIYIACNPPFQGSVEMAYRLQFLVSIGSSVTLASAVLWGIAVYVWMHLLPDLPPEIAAQLAQDTNPQSPG